MNTLEKNNNDEGGSEEIVVKRTTSSGGPGLGLPGKSHNRVLFLESAQQRGLPKSHHLESGGLRRRNLGYRQEHQGSGKNNNVV